MPHRSSRQKAVRRRAGPPAPAKPRPPAHPQKPRIRKTTPINRKDTKRMRQVCTCNPIRQLCYHCQLRSSSAGTCLSCGAPCDTTCKLCYRYQLRSNNPGTCQICGGPCSESFQTSGQGRQPQATVKRPAQIAQYVNGVNAPTAYEILCACCGLLCNPHCTRCPICGSRLNGS